MIFFALPCQVKSQAVLGCAFQYGSQEFITSKCLLTTGEVSSLLSASYGWVNSPRAREME